MKLHVVLALVLLATVQIIDGLASEPVPVPGPEPCAITQDALDELAQLRAIVTQLGTLVEKLTGQSRIPAEENRIRPPCPGCTTEYDPVCGSNGETYSNMCMLIVAQCELVEVELDHEGACDESQTSPEANVERIIPPCPTCTAQYLPVCGTNGETYTNMCMLRVAQCEEVEVEFDYNGPCTTEVDHLINPYLWASYNNATVTWVLPLGEVLEYIVTVVSEEGEDSTKLPPLSTSFSTSVVKDQNYTIRITPVMSDGPGQEYDSGVFIPACPEFCTFLHEPVCGTDRKTYGNRCNLEVAMCNDEEGTLALAYPGSCTTDENELRDAALEYTWREASLSWTAPVDEVVGYTAKVISEEGEDTTRLSALEVSFTISVKPGQNYTIEITPIMGDGPGTTYSTGIFIPTCPQICTFEYDPLCATDGNTYSNPCAFEIAVCETGDVTLMIDHQGTCDPCELIQCSPPLCEPPFVLGEAPLPGECCIGCVDKCESIACDVPQCEPGYLIGRVEGDCCDSCIRQVYADCSNASESGITTNGLYLIQPFGVAEPVEVTCDFENGGGKWTVILRRVPSDVDFLRSYNEYVAGFGDADGAYWIGLENLYQLNKHGNTKLFVSGTDHQGTSAGGHYNNFKVGTAEEDYALKIIAGYRAQANGNIGNALFYNKGAPFSAPDRDNDGAARNCASDLGGGFWYKGSICTRANPLGEFLTPSEFALEKGIFWATFRGKGKSLQFLEMKIRTA